MSALAIPAVYGAVSFSLPGIPVGKGRARSRIARAATGRQFVTHYTPKETRSYEGMVRQAAALAMGNRPPMECPVVLSVNAVFAIPPSMPKYKQALARAGEHWPGVKPDLDNLVKAICDGIQKIIIRDDALICRMVLVKRYGLQPAVHVMVAPL